MRRGKLGVRSFLFKQGSLPWSSPKRHASKSMLSEEDAMQCNPFWPESRPAIHSTNKEILCQRSGDSRNR